MAVILAQNALAVAPNAQQRQAMGVNLALAIAKLSDDTRSSLPHMQTIYLHQLAPAKPALKAPCNGCGICCAVEPCPIGMLISRKRQGRCAALLWDEMQTRYICGMVAQPDAYLAIHWPWLNRLISRWARRWIAVGIGCDSNATIVNGADQ